MKVLPELEEEIRKKLDQFDKELLEVNPNDEEYEQIREKYVEEFVSICLMYG